MKILDAVAPRFNSVLGVPHSIRPPPGLVTLGPDQKSHKVSYLGWFERVVDRLEIFRSTEMKIEAICFQPRMDAAEFWAVSDFQGPSNPNINPVLGQGWKIGQLKITIHGDIGRNFGKPRNAPHPKFLSRNHGRRKLTKGRAIVNMNWPTRLEMIPDTVQRMAAGYFDTPWKHQPGGKACHKWGQLELRR